MLCSYCQDEGFRMLAVDTCPRCLVQVCREHFVSCGCEAYDEPSE